MHILWGLCHNERVEVESTMVFTQKRPRRGATLRGLYLCLTLVPAHQVTPVASVEKGSATIIPEFDRVRREYLFIELQILRAQKDAHDSAGVVADDVAQHAHQQSGANQLGPALGDSHARGGGGAADVGVGGDDRVL